MGQELNGRQKDGTFAPGWKGGPGRPKIGQSYADIIRSQMDEVKDGKTEKERLVSKIKELALKGTPWAVEWLADRDEGKSAVNVNLNQKRNPLSNLTDEEIREMLEAIKMKKAAIDTKEPKSLPISDPPKPEPRPTDL